MGNLGATEILLIFLVVLLLFGARRIPEIARGLGKGIREFKDATTDIKRELTVDDARRPSLPPQGQTFARDAFTSDPAAGAYAPASDPGYAPAASSTPGTPGAMNTGIGGVPVAAPAHGSGVHESGRHETGVQETGDAAHGIPSTGTAQAPFPPLEANDQPPPRTGA